MKQVADFLAMIDQREADINAMPDEGFVQMWDNGLAVRFIDNGEPRACGLERANVLPVKPREYFLIYNGKDEPAKMRPMVEAKEMALADIAMVRKAVMENMAA